MKQTRPLFNVTLIISFDVKISTVTIISRKSLPRSLPKRLVRRSQTRNRYVEALS